MVEHHLSWGAHLLLWVFPLALTAATVLAGVLARPAREERP